MRRDPGSVEDPVTEYGGITRFREETVVPVGRFSVTNQRIPIDFFHDDVGSDTLVVFFHGAVRKDQTGPWFVGEGVLEGLPANRLSVSDPSLYLDDDLTLGWFIGSKHQNDVQGIIRRVIERITEITGIEHLIFMGGSGGGFAALDMSRRFPGSLALPMNPQTSIRWYAPQAVARYLRVAWGPGVDYPDELPRRAVHDQVAAYAEGQVNTVGYIQNTRDARHISDHMGPFMRVAGGRSGTWLLMGDWGDAAGDEHVPPPKSVLRDVLATVVGCAGDWPTALERVGFSRQSSRQDVH